MTTVSGFTHVNELIAAGEPEQALAELGGLHRDWHDRPIRHVQIHWLRLRIFASNGAVARAAWELVALLFAVPVSLAQRYLGIARRDI